MAKLKKIFFVEDDRDIQKIIGFSFSGMEALEKLKSFKPDLILLDVMMPVMDGPTMLKKLADATLLKSIPVIMITAKVQPHEVDEYKEMGALGVISKPFNPLTLSDEIAEIWKQIYGQD